MLPAPTLGLAKLLVLFSPSMDSESGSLHLGCKEQQCPSLSSSTESLAPQRVEGQDETLVSTSFAVPAGSTWRGLRTYSFWAESFCIPEPLHEDVWAVSGAEGSVKGHGNGTSLQTYHSSQAEGKLSLTKRAVKVSVAVSAGILNFSPAKGHLEVICEQRRKASVTCMTSVPKSLV